MSIIKNRSHLETSEMRRKALDIIEAGITRVLPSQIIPSAVSFDRPTRTLYLCGEKHFLKGRIFVIGGGKAAGLMAETLENIIGADNITAGIVIDKADPQEFKTNQIQIVQAGHPLPDVRGVEAVNRILQMKQAYSIGKDDTILALISGGGSALMPSPAEGISLDDKQQVTRLLLSCGASIQEINSVRKHLSLTKGGRLAQYFVPATIISLILSDVIGNDLSVIASGMTYPDKSKYSDALAVLEKYGLTGKVPENAISILQKGVRGEIAETAKSLENVHNYIIGDLEIALEAMADKARGMGFRPCIITARQMGDTTAAARLRASEILSGVHDPYNPLFIGGETTPTLPSHPGKGGRNQHYAACSMELLESYPGKWVLASVGTDGSDFIPEVAGAIVDQDTIQSIRRKVPDFQAKIDSYDSYPLLSQTENSLIITGATNTNVGDLILYLFQDN
jgi:hydroxypyruvate reductase/glycerate 2-kinase